MAVLPELPREITLRIAQFLSPASAASFAHCCRTVLNTLGTRHWQAIREANQRQDLEQFLRLLGIDLPDHVLCCHCLILHRIGDPEHRGEECYSSELFGGVYNYIHKNITFSSIGVTMKRYRQGLDYSRFLERFSCRFMGTSENLPYQFLSRAKIINGSLFLRVQESLLFVNGFPPRMPIIGHIAICSHAGFVGTSFEARLPEHMQCTLHHNHEVEQCIRSSGTRQCAYCPTEFQIELQGCADPGVALVATKWLDIGEGRTVLDPKWWSRLSTRYTNHGLFANTRGVYREELMDRLPVPSELTSIRDLLESEEDLQLARRRGDKQSQLLDPSNRLQTWAWIRATLRVQGQYFWDPR